MRQPRLNATAPLGIGGVLAALPLIVQGDSRRRFEKAPETAEIGIRTVRLPVSDAHSYSSSDFSRLCRSVSDA
jgi:hypothetical protein